MKVIVQYASDLHTERVSTSFGKLLTIGKDVDVLVLAGDIGNPRQETYGKFLWWCSQQVKHTIFTTGNHEYFGSSIDETEGLIQQLVNEINTESKRGMVHFLQQDSIVIKGIKFIGACLWTPLERKQVNNVVINHGDHVRIEDFDTNKRTMLHHEQLNYIEKELRLDEIPCVIVTHHPTITFMTHKPTQTSCLYYNQCQHLGKYAVAAISGHTHTNWVLNFNGCKYLSNCRGHDVAKHDYNPTATFTIETTVKVC